MQKSNPLSDKLFLGLGIITIICGISLAIQGKAAVGIPGSLIGLWLVLDNLKNLRNRVRE